MLTEKHALKLIHSKLNKVRHEYKKGKDYTPCLEEIQTMVGDLIAAKKSSAENIN